jgi:hypothetical protein
MKRMRTVRFHVGAHQKKLFVIYDIGAAQPLFQRPRRIELNRLVRRDEPAQRIHGAGLQNPANKVDAQSGRLTTFSSRFQAALVFTACQAEPLAKPFRLSPIFLQRAGFWLALNCCWCVHGPISARRALGAHGVKDHLAVTVYRGRRGLNVPHWDRQRPSTFDQEHKLQSFATVLPTEVDGRGDVWTGDCLREIRGKRSIPFQINAFSNNSKHPNHSSIHPPKIYEESPNSCI